VTLLLTPPATLAATNQELTDTNALAGRTLLLTAPQEFIQEDIGVSTLSGTAVQAKNATHRRG
jgi:hypothetical protein